MRDRTFASGLPAGISHGWEERPQVTRAAGRRRERQRDRMTAQLLPARHQPPAPGSNDSVQQYR